MRIYISFDDTDVAGADRGTGKLARWFEEKLPENVALWGVIRQQLPRFEGVPYTSNNSSACVVVDAEDASVIPDLIERAVSHMAELYIEGSDPGLCVMSEDNPTIPSIMVFGRECCSRVVTQKEAMKAAKGIHLSGHGGTNDGIIGAVAGVGLTISGWSGRFVEFGRLRAFPDKVKVGDLEESGIQVLSIDRNALVPWVDHTVDTCGWLRPRLWGFHPVLPVRQVSDDMWEAVGKKNSEA